MQGTHGVKDGKDGDANIGEDRHPHIGDTECGKDKHRHLDANGEPDILIGNAKGLLGDANAKGYFGRLVVHQYYIRGFDSSIGAQASHCDTEVGTCQDRCIVDTITHESKGLTLLLLAEQTFDLSDLVRRHEFGMVLVQSDLSGNELAALWSPVSMTVRRTPACLSAATASAESSLIRSEMTI